MQAQNLVPNSSFEQIKKQPCDVVGSFRSISEYFYNWEAPTTATTDAWYSSIDTTTNCIVNTYLYNAVPHSGSFCIGLLTSSIRSENLPTRNGYLEYREYAQVRLTQSLKPGTLYYAEMYVLSLPAAGMSSNNIGMYFSADSIRRYTTGTGTFTYRLPYTPQINESGILDKSDKWIKISGCFTVSKSCNYLTIGNFFDDKDMIYVNKSSTTNRFTRAPYYLVDDVLVRESTEPEIARAFGRNIDTTLCQQANWTARPQLPAGVTISWENGSNVPIRTITQPGTYRITASRGECMSTDTLRVRREVNPVLPPDTVLCRGETLRLGANHSLKTYSWSSGSTDSSVSITETGTYQLRIPSPYCRLSDEIDVHFLDCPGLIPNVITPNGDGKNDTFRLDNTDLTDWKFEVYNRWGKRVHSSFPYRNEWDGSDLPSGVYYYSLQSAALKRELKGWIQLVR